MSRMTIGEAKVRTGATRRPVEATARPRLDRAALRVDTHEGLPAVAAVDLKVRPGEIVGIAGVSGNGQSELVQALAGQRPLKDGRIRIDGKPFNASRRDCDGFKVFSLPEGPLRNAAVKRMRVAETIAFRSFDKPPLAGLGGWLSPVRMHACAADLIGSYRVRTRSTDTPIESLSGGNVQRTVVAREPASIVRVLLVGNPCFRLDFASVAEIGAQIADQRNRGALALPVSADLDEIRELSNRVAVTSGARIAHLLPIAKADRNTIGKVMAGQGAGH
jgi:ABC-type uncharacterized transport system ATPase subunit